MNNENTRNYTKKFMNRFMIGFIITTTIWGIAILPKQTSKAEWIISDIQWNTSWFESIQMTDWTGYNNPIRTNIGINTTIPKETRPIIRNSIWNWETKETSEKWNESILGSDDIRIQANCNEIQLSNPEAQERSKYACLLHPDAEMLSSYHQESWWNIWAIWLAWEEWVCQLMNNKTNSVWLNDPRFNDKDLVDWKFQIESCVAKRKAVPWKTKWVIRASLWSQENKKYLYLYTK